MSALTINVFSVVRDSVVTTTSLVPFWLRTLVRCSHVSWLYVYSHYTVQNAKNHLNHPADLQTVLLQLPVLHSADATFNIILNVFIGLTSADCVRQVININSPTWSWLKYPSCWVHDSHDVGVSVDVIVCAGIETNINE